MFLNFIGPNFWEIVNKFGIIIGLFTFVFSSITFLIVKKQQKRIKRLVYGTPPIKDYQPMFESFKTIQTESAYAVCISLLPNTDSIKEQVNSFLMGNKMKVKDTIEIKMDGISPDNIPDYIQKLRELRRGALSDAPEVRLCIAGPVQAGTLAGAIFDNWIPVLLYGRAGTKYEYWGPLIKQ
jgi:hypothetical protein